MNTPRWVLFKGLWSKEEGSSCSNAGLRARESISSLSERVLANALAKQASLSKRASKASHPN